MEGLNLGALDYIHKPFVSSLLLKRIETHLSLIECQKELQRLLKLKTEEVWERKAEAEKALKASFVKGEFLSHMSH